MKKILAIFLFLTMLATACGTAEDAVTDAAESGDDSDFATDDAMEDSGDAGDAAEVVETEAAEADSGAQAPASAPLGSGGSAQALDTEALGRDIIFTAVVSIGVDNVEESGRRATEIIGELGGFVFGQNTSGGAEPRSELVFKVRPADFAMALERLGGIGELRNQQITTDDVTERVVDLNSRIEVAELGVDRLREAMESTADLENFARLEELLLSRESDLEVMRGQLRTLRDQVDLATITLILEQDAVRNAVGFEVTVYEGHDDGSLCPGRSVNEQRFEPGDELTVCFETRNLGDQALTEVLVEEKALEIEGPDSLTLVAGDPDDVQPGQSVIQAFEFEADRDVFLRASVTAVPVAGDDGKPAGRVVRSQLSPEVRVDEDAADPGFSDGFGAAVSLLRSLWVVATVAVGFFLPLLILLPLVWLVWRALRRWRDRRAEEAARARVKSEANAQQWTPPPPPPPAAGSEEE